MFDLCHAHMTNGRAPATGSTLEEEELGMLVEKQDMSRNFLNCPLTTFLL